MTNAQRVRNAIIGFLIMALGLLMMTSPASALKTISFIICLTLLARGIKNLYFYSTMGRHMVGGKNSLISGVIMTDLGLFTLSLDSLPTMFIILYLLIIYAFKGAIDMMMAIQARRSGTRSWKFNFATGCINLLMAIASFVFGAMRGSTGTVGFVYSAGLAYAGFARMINAFRKTAITYIQ